MKIYGLSKRLETIASFVPTGARLLDIGSDHAYLPVALVKAGQIKRAIAGEVVEGPYQSACSTVRSSGFSERIEVRLADGLDALRAGEAVDTVTICGMGGRLISSILAEGKTKLSTVERLILQPNNREDDLRRWLMENHFQLVAETILIEQGKFYEILVAQKGNMQLTEQELRFGPYLLKENSLVFRHKWQQEADTLRKALLRIPSQHLLERMELEKKIQVIEEILRNES